MTNADDNRDEKVVLERCAPDGKYEPPQVTALGTLEQLTQGIVPTNVDSVLPGSIN